MTDKQPEALRLADALEEFAEMADRDRAAALLRAQHAALERKDALLRRLIAALDLDRHDVDDWPPDSCEAVYAIKQELSQ